MVTAPSFPIAFEHADGLAVYINTTWGEEINQTLGSIDRSHSDYVWVNLPETSPGGGNVSIILDHNLVLNESVSWARFQNPTHDPFSLTIEYNWFRYWLGSTLLTASFSNNGTVEVNYTILHVSHYNDYPNETLPYYPSFYFSTSMTPSEWQLLIGHIQASDAINWQSWDYFPPAYTMGDLGGWKTTLTINWNESSQTRYSTMMDDDSSPNQRIITTQDAQEFQDLLLAKTEELIAGYLVNSTTSEPSTTPEVNTTTSEFSSTSKVNITTTPFQSPGLVFTSLLVSLFVVILWRRKKFKKLKEKKII
ncbi:MAG: hypothetical protein JSV04_09225 [Candidatus Heimdallarchaeota archaeon]|nr:MAG: hypothetical protein JSV04_09225 [Candidatus Heimdallarchaeota archaeon]